MCILIDVFVIVCIHSCSPPAVLKLERKWKALEKKEKKMNTLQEEYDNKKDTFENQSQTLQFLKDKVLKQNKRIKQLQNILSEQDGEINSLKEELRMSRLTLVSSS